MKKKSWLKNEFSDKNEFCPIKEGIFYPEEAKPELDKNDILIGEYWFDGNDWCFSLFPKYENTKISPGRKNLPPNRTKYNHYEFKFSQVRNKYLTLIF